MGLAIIAMAVITGLVAAFVISDQHGTFSGYRVSPVSGPVSPLDEAERILAGRYARGEITPDEFSRMLAVLRR